MSDFLNALAKLSAAEEFLTFLKVPFEGSVVQVNRLHILKRFNQYLAQAGLPGDKPEAALPAAYADCLQRAYDDLSHSSGVEEKMFKVFKDAEKSREASFVPLSTISRKE